jgi:hypothetical protein
MNSAWIARTALVALVCALAGTAAQVARAQVASTAAAAAGNQVAGTVDTQLTIKHFTAIGSRIVGHGAVISTFRNAAGPMTSTTRKGVRFTLRQQQLVGPGPCSILFLQLDELDLTLLGLHVFLRSATEGEPIQLTLSADSTHGVLGKLFCNLVQNATIGGTAAAQAAATSLNKRVHQTVLLHAKATLYKPGSTRKTQAVKTAAVATANCPVLNLVLGPLHLDLLGLIVDLNKVALDIDAVPGTLVGNLFCQLSGGAAPTATTPAAPATTTTPVAPVTTTAPAPPAAG